MAENIINTDNNYQLREYCKACVCQSCKQIEELKQENEQLKDVTCDAIIEQEKLIKQLTEIREDLETCKYQWYKQSEIAEEWFKIADKYKLALKEIRDYCEKCKKCVETGDEVILYTVIKKVNEVLNEQ